MGREIQILAVAAVVLSAMIMVSSGQTHGGGTEENPEGFQPRECMAAIKSVHGCADAIKGIFHGHFGGLKRTCCRTLNGLTDSCWPSLFPGKLWLRLTVKLVCLFKNMNLALPELQEHHLQ